ncbi:MAG: alpha/beta hydrolase [Alphaproteobacteria bacterium]|nr:alpha/beta hydrolase [Alphaproteobacteria bacterium]
MLAALLWAALGFVTPAQAEAVRIAHDGRTLNGELAVPDGGTMSGGLVILVHGTLMHGRMEIMAALQEALSERGIASLAITLSLGVDNRRGPYDCAIPYRETLQQTVREIGAWARWAKGRGASRVDLAGHSRGGAQAAFALATAATNDIRRLILIAPTIFGPEDVAAAYAATFGIDLSARIAEARRLQSAPGADMRGVGFLYCRAATVSPQAFLDTYTGAERHDTPTLLQRISVPTLVVIAGNDEVVRGLGTRLPAASDRLRIATVDGADHFFRDLYGDDLAEAVATFVKQ